MPKSTVKKLLIFTAFLFTLNGCGGGGSSGGSGGSDSDSGGFGVSVAPKGDGSALVSWTPPIENTDNSALTDLAGYKIYYGTFPGDYDKTITITNAGLSSYLVEGLADEEGLSAEDWYFVMTAFNSSGIESVYSTEAYRSID
jgi:hypothetical protein